MFVAVTSQKIYKKAYLSLAERREKDGKKESRHWALDGENITVWKVFYSRVFSCVMEQDTKAGQLFTEIMETEGMI